MLYQVEPLPDLMVHSRGFEPPTLWSVVKCSIQLSYECISWVPIFVKKWWLQLESNQRHQDFQSCALPTELWSHKKWRFVRDLNPWSLAWQASVITTTPTNHGCERRIWTTDLWVMSPASYQSAPSRDVKKLAEEKGFEPLRRFLDLPVFKTGPFNQTWVFLHKYYWCPRPESNRHGLLHPQDFKSCASTYSATEAHLVSRWGFEPQTPWLKVKCSTGWASETSIIKIKWLPRLDSNQRNARVKVLCLTTWLRGN